MRDEMLQEINRHAEQEYPEECCGMLLGKRRADDSEVEHVIAIDNSQGENRKRRFLVTPEQYRQAEKEAETMGSELLGFYHSHPDHPAIPSTFDTDHALPWFAYLIVSVMNGKSGDATVWTLWEDRSRFDQVGLDVKKGIHAVRQ
jgi:proteasome lid subunit RPN8/RPN11